MKSKTKKRKSKIFIVILTFFFLCLIGYFYIDKIFLPIQLKQIILKTARIALGRDITFEKARYNPVKGIIVENLVVYEKAPSTDAFIKIPQASFNIFLPSILKDKKIVIPYLSLKNPSILITRTQSDSFNFSDILGKFRPQKAQSKPQSFILGGLSIENGQINYTDQTPQAASQETIQNIHLKVGLSLESMVKFFASARIPHYASELKVQGEYLIPSQELKGKLTLQDIPLNKIAQLVYRSDETTLNQGQLKAAEFLVNKKDGVWQVKGSFYIPSLDLTTKSVTRLKGNLSTDTLALSYGNKNLTIAGNLNLKEGSLLLTRGSEITGNFSAQNSEFTYLNKEVSLKGSFNLDSAKIKIDPQKELTASLYAQNTVLKIKDSHLFLTTACQLNEANLKISPAVVFKGNANVEDLSLTLQGKDLSLNSRFQISNGDFTFDADKKFLGNPSVNLQLQYQPQAVKPLSYSGTLKVNNANVAGVPKINSIQGLTTEFTFAEDKISSESFKFSALETSIELSGKLENLRNPKADINFSVGKISIDKLASLAPALFEQYPIDLKGQAQLKGSYRGHLQNPSSAYIQTVAKLFDASLSFKKSNQTITGLNGEISYAPQAFGVKNLSGTYLHKNYVLNGQADFADSSQIKAAATLSADRVEAAAQISGSANNYQISSLTGTFYDSSFDIKGKIDVFKDIVNLNLTGRAALELKNFTYFIPSESEETFKKIKPEGKVNLNFSLSGPTTLWRNWQITADAAADKLSLYGHPLEEAAVKYAQRNRRVEQATLSSQIYGGRLLINLSGDFNDELTAQATASLSDLDLARLKDTLSMQNKNLAGILSSSVTFSGPLKNHKKLQGQGNIAITNGNLWRLNLIDGIMQAILVEEYQNIVFTDASSDFMIRNGKLQTNNLFIQGSTADLTGEGWIDFNHSIGFIVKPKFKKDVLFKNETWQKATSLVLSQTDYLAIKIMGTIDKPIYLPITDPTEIFKKATDILKEGVGDILQDIF